jgi:hypothetical protein
MARPRPAPGRPASRAALKRLEDREEVFGWHADSLIANSDDHFTALDVDGDGDAALRRRELDRVLEQIDERPFDLAGIDFDHRHLIRQRNRDARGVEAERVESPAHQFIHRPELRTSVDRTHFEAGEVEKVGDEAVEPLRLEPDRG